VHIILYINGKLRESTVIFWYRLDMFSSSNGKIPHNIAYRITPQLHTSTSGPA
jgi:hypothetical protein